MISYGTNPVEPIKNYGELWPSVIYITTKLLNPHLISWNLDNPKQFYQRQELTNLLEAEESSTGKRRFTQQQCVPNWNSVSPTFQISFYLFQWSSKWFYLFLKRFFPLGRLEISS